MTRPPSRSESSGWTKPTSILAALSLLASGGWAWVGMTRDDTQQIEQRAQQLERRLRAVEVGLARIETRLEHRRD